MYGAITRLHQQRAKLLHCSIDFAQRRFAVFDGGGLRIQHALIGLHARQARAGALGLRGGHRVIAGAQHALASRGVFHLAGQLGLLLADVADGAVIHVGSAQSANAHGELLIR